MDRKKEKNAPPPGFVIRRDAGELKGTRRSRFGAKLKGFKKPPGDCAPCFPLIETLARVLEKSSGDPTLAPAVRRV